MRHLVDKIDHNAFEISRYKEYYLDDARMVLISYGSSARSALHVVKKERSRGNRVGLLELQTLWPFPAPIVQEKCANARWVIVVEMNMGQVTESVRRVVDKPEQVLLANRVDGTLITPTNIRDFLRVVQGRGV